MVIQEDIKKYNSKVTGRGIIYLIGLLLIVVLSVFKFLIMIIHDIHYAKDEDEMPMTNLIREDTESYTYKMSDALLSIHNSNVGAKELLCSSMEGVKNTAKVEALRKLRDFFLTNTVLEGNILKTKFTNVSYEELYRSFKENVECKPYFIQHITFGKEMNRLLHDAYGYPIKQKKLSVETYLLFNGGETFELEKTLQNEFYCDNIILRLFDKEQKK